MPDSIRMLVGREVVDCWRSYTIDADIYQAAGAFTFELDPTRIVRARRGDRCELYVNSVRVLTGVIDSVTTGYTKSGRRRIIQGRDLIGQAVDCYCEQWMTLKGKTLVQVAEMLLADVPHLSTSNVIYGSEAYALQSSKSYTQIEPGQTVFDVLAQMAHSRGLMFYALADGTLVFDRPKMRHMPKYRVLVRHGMNLTDILDAQLVEDCSRHYAKIVVVGQQQDAGSGTSASSVNVTATQTDSTAPLSKTMVAVHNGDSESPAALARKLVEQQQAAARRIDYTVAGHTQFGVPWQIDEMVFVWDDQLGVLGEVLLVTTRSMELTRSRGAITRVRLGPPGVIA